MIDFRVKCLEITTDATPSKKQYAENSFTLVKVKLS